MIIIDLSEYLNNGCVFLSGSPPAFLGPVQPLRNVSAPPHILQLKINAISRPLWQLLLSAIESSQDIVLVFRILLL